MDRLARANPEVRAEARPAAAAATAAPAQAPARQEARSSGGTRKPDGGDRRKPDGDTPARSTSTGDGVALSPQAQDAAAKEKQELDRRLPEEDRSEPEGTETHSDGTVVERKDGRTTTRKPDGSIREEYQDGDRWVVEERYEAPDGTKVHDREVRHTNGDVQTVSTAEKDGRVETTESYTTDENVEIPKRLRNVHADSTRAADAEAAGMDVQTSLDPEPASRTTVRKTVTDANGNTTELLNRTTYTEKYPLEGGVPYEGNEKASVENKRLYGGMEVHRAGSGTTRTYTDETFLGPDGKTHTQTSFGSRTVVAGSQDGRHVEVSSSQVSTNLDGKESHESTREVRGLYVNDPDSNLDIGRAGDIDQKDEYRNRLGDGPVNFRRTTVWGDDAKAKATTEEYGDYTNPDSAGRSVSIAETPDGRKYWSYRQVENTDTGVRVRQQTNLQGSDEYVLSDGYKNRDGTYRTEAKYYDADGNVVRTEKASRERVDARYMASRQRGIDPGLRDEFVRSNSGRDMYEEEVFVHDTRDPQNNQETTLYTAAGSDDRLATVKHEGRDVTVLEDPGSATPARISAEGVQFAIDREGHSYAIVDGQRVDLPAPGAPEGPGAHGYTDNSAQAVRNLYASVMTAKAGGTVQDFGMKLATPMAALTGGVGIANVYLGLRDGNAGQMMGGAASTAAAVGEGSMLAGELVANTTAKSLLTNGGRVLGAFGAGLSIGNGLHQYAEGDYVGGTLSIAGGVGGGMVVGAGIAGVAGWVPIAGWAIAGTALAAGIGWDMYRHHEETHKTHGLEF